MTSERLLNTSIEVLYLPPKNYTPKTNFWLRPCSDKVKIQWNAIAGGETD